MKPIMFILLKPAIMMCFIFSTLLLISSNHPIIKLLMVILQVPLYSFTLNLIFKSSWFSLILFITFVGGILIIFIYTVSLLENEILIKANLNFMMSLFLLFLLIFLSFLMQKKVVNSNNFLTMDMSFMFYTFSKSLYKISSLLIVYLFLSMISMVKIIMMEKKNY